VSVLVIHLSLDTPRREKAGRHQAVSKVKERPRPRSPHST
jgi:hypothetical protein